MQLTLTLFPGFMLPMLSQFSEGQDRQTTLPLPISWHFVLAMSMMGGMGGRAKASVVRKLTVKRNFILGGYVNRECKWFGEINE